jgi:uncharacterized protein YbjT (DUF2867 family)
MKTVAMAGASGVVGARVLQRLLARDDIGCVVALGRRVLSVQHDKLVSKVVDLQDVTSVAEQLPDDVDVAFCCLGTTMKQSGSKAAFRAVDRDAVLAFAEAALRKGAQRFVVVSSIGASPASRSFYLRTKGETENALAELGYPQLTVVRPSIIDDEGAREAPRPGERLGLTLAKAVFSIAGKTRRHAPIPADTIAQAMVHLAFDDTTARVRTVESDRLHGLAG